MKANRDAVELSDAISLKLLATQFTGNIVTTVVTLKFNRWFRR